MPDTAIVPARFRLMQQEEFARKFRKNVLSAFIKYEAAVHRNDYEAAEKIRIDVLLPELDIARGIILDDPDDREAWDMSEEFSKSK